MRTAILSKYDDCMTRRKERLTVTVDHELVAAGNAAVQRGLADSLSAWVNTAMAAQAARDERLRAMAEAIASYEDEYGVITAEEMAVQQRADRVSATVVRSARAAQT
jgi:hypothetical protein